MLSPKPIIRLLLVDDEPDQLELIELGLGSYDDLYVIDTVVSPYRALELIQSSIYDCIVSDYMMPGLTGLELCERIRSSVNFTPFIIFTGHGSEEVAAKAFEVGVDGYLMKEGKLVVYRILSKLIQQLVEKRRIEEQLRITNEEVRTANVRILEYSNRLEEMVEERTAQLRENESRLRGFMDSAPDMFWLFSPDLRLVDLNSKALDLLGARREDVIGLRFEEVVPGIEEMERYSVLKKVLETGEPEYIESYQPVSKFGRMWVRVWAFKSGDNLGLILRNVTDQKLAEERLRRSKEFNVVSSIGATVAHDLRNPLSKINQSIEFARKSPDKAERMLEIAQESAMHALNMVEEFRQATRRIEVKKLDVNLRTLVVESLGSVKIPEKVDLQVDISSEVGLVCVDPELLQRALVNLTLNAVEAMPDGGKLMVYANRSSDVITIEVADTGVGMSPEVVERLWEPLFTTKARGLGLGLYFVRNALDAHGGSIELTTEPGKGTNFKVKIPSR